MSSRLLPSERKVTRQYLANRCDAQDRSRRESRDHTYIPPEVLPGLREPHVIAIQEKEYAVTEKLLGNTTCDEIIKVWEQLTKNGELGELIKNNVTDQPNQIKLTPARKLYRIPLSHKHLLQPVCEKLGIDYKRYCHRPILIWTLQNGKKQFRHLDYAPEETFCDEIDGTVPCSFIVALENHVSLFICDQKTGREKEVYINRGHGIIFSRHVCHAGAPYINGRALRLFFASHDTNGDMSDCPLDVKQTEQDSE